MTQAIIVNDNTWKHALRTVLTEKEAHQRNWNAELK